MDSKIIERVRKLLELANNNTNVHEAANAAAQAQVLMSRFEIGEAMLGAETDTIEEQIEADVLYAGGNKASTWRGQLAVPLCEVNSCGVYRSGGDLRIFGRPSDASKVRYLFAYVAREIERLCKEAAAERGAPGRTWCNSFKLGASSEIGRRLREADREARAAMKREADAGDSLGTGTALVLVNTALAKVDARRASVVQWGKVKLHLRAGGVAHSRTDYGAREAGKRAASSINLSGARASLGSGSRKSLAG
jgi:hypothetical protein